MEKTGQEIIPSAGTPYFLTEVLGTHVFIKDKKIGKLDDFVIVDGDKIAEVTHLYVFRPFGYPPLLIPWEKVKVMTTREIVVDIDDP